MTSCLGEVFGKLCELEKEKHSYKVAIEVFRSIGDAQGEAFCLQSLGRASVRICYYSQAEKFYKQALLLLDGLAVSVARADTLRELADVYLRMGKVDIGRSFAHTAMRAYAGLHNHYGEADCLVVLGEIARKSEDVTEAVRLYTRARLLFVQTHNRREIGRAHV